MNSSLSVVQAVLNFACPLGHFLFVQLMILFEDELPDPCPFGKFIFKIYLLARNPLVQGFQILLMSGVTVTSTSQILESFWNIWSQVSQRKKPFSDFSARCPGMYTLS